MPVGDLPGWKQVFADDFATDVPLGSFPGASYNNRWFPYNPGCCDTSGYGTYDASKVVSVSGGVMDAYLHTEGGTHYVNAMVAKAPATGWGQLYGRYSIRMKADPIPGYKVVPLLWPDSDIWDQGEIDFPEVNVLSVGEKAKANVYLAGRWQNFQSTVDLVGGWHIYTSEWSPGLLTFSIDGVRVWTTSKDVPTVPMHYVVQFESAIGVGAPANTAAGHVQVDWTTMYSRTP
jgi:beta-glucanase (GH16 family)